MSRRGSAGSLGDALARYLKRIDSGKNLSQARVIQVWEEAVGPEITRHTAGAHIRGDELVVYVDSPIWATELNALSGKLAERLNECLGEELVGKMRFSVSRKVVLEQERQREREASGVFYGPDRVKPVPLTQTELDEVRESASSIGSETLRETVIRATIKDLEWKRGMALAGPGGDGREVGAKGAQSDLATREGEDGGELPL